MKTIILALLIAYSLGITYSLNTLGYSGDKTINVTSNKQGNANDGPSGHIAKKCILKIQKYQIWKFLLSKRSLGDGAVWITPNSSKIVYPCDWTTTYTTVFKDTCPNNSVTLTIASTGYFEVFLNGKLVGEWHQHFPKIAKIELNATCGENTLKIVVFNQCPSPSAIIYQLTQSPYGCPKCAAPQVLNNHTCICQCPNVHFCPANEIFNTTVCECVSRCPVPQKCPKGKVWNSLNCLCICEKQPAVCPGNSRLDENTCKCVCIDTVLCIKGTHFDNKQCKCVKDKCQHEEQEDEDQHHEGIYV